MTDRVLHEGKWLSLRVKDDPDHGIQGYEYVHNVPGDGKGIAVLPFRWLDTPDGPDDERLEFLVVHEIIPPWSLDQSMCSLTGLCEKDESLIPTVQREIKEESGYTADLPQIFSLGTCHVSKSADTTLHLYAANLTNAGPPERAVGDGSKLEDRLTHSWTTAPYGSPDPVLSILWARFNYSYDKLPDKL